MARSGRGPGPASLFDEMCARHAPSLHRWVVGRGASAPEACDLVQEAFERALRTQPPVGNHDELRAWLVVVIRRLFIDSRRTLKARRWVSADLARQPAPPDDVVAKWRQIDITEALAGLAPCLRIVLELQAAGCSHQQIAEHLEIPRATVGTRAFRARRQVRQRFASRWSEPHDRN